MKLYAVPIAIISLILMAPGAFAFSCVSPLRPFVPTESVAAMEYRDLIKQDFESYLSDVQGYLRCLEEERVRAFEEARDVTNEYGAFLDLTTLIKEGPVSSN